MRARSRAGVEAPRLRTSQPSPSRKSATIWTPSAWRSSGLPVTTASRPSFGAVRMRGPSMPSTDCVTAVALCSSATEKSPTAHQRPIS